MLDSDSLNICSIYAGLNYIRLSCVEHRNVRDDGAIFIQMGTLHKIHLDTSSYNED